MRRVILDTETTGLRHQDGHRILEIACLEIVNGKPTGNGLHEYINPEMEIDPGASRVHGITNEMVSDMPTFVDLAEAIAEFIKGAQLVIHNANFDIGFLNKEFKRAGMGANWVYKNCKVLCTLEKARSKYPGKRNNLDALCERFGVDNSKRGMHDALTDVALLGEVFYHLTGSKTVYEFSNVDSPARQKMLERQTKAPRPVSSQTLQPVPRQDNSKVWWWFFVIVVGALILGSVG